MVCVCVCVCPCVCGVMLCVCLCGVMVCHDYFRLVSWIESAGVLMGLSSRVLPACGPADDDGGGAD